MSDRSQTPLGSYIDDIYHFGSDHTDHTLADSDLEDSTNKKHETNPRGRFTPVTATRTSSLHPEVVEHPYQLQKDEEIQALFDASLDNIPRSVECRWKACGAKLGSLAILERVSSQSSSGVHLESEKELTKVWLMLACGTPVATELARTGRSPLPQNSWHTFRATISRHSGWRVIFQLQKDHNMLRNHLHTFHGLEDAQLHQLPLSAFHLLPSSLTLLPLPVAQTPTYFVGLPKVSTSKSAKLDTTKSLGYTARDPLVEDILDEDRPFVEEMGRLELSRSSLSLWSILFQRRRSSRSLKDGLSPWPHFLMAEQTAINRHRAEILHRSAYLRRHSHLFQSRQQDLRRETLPTLPL
ncbi:hypothetical protein FRB94_001925 [Tulasnella sp. JGI-2019a]|nr:hypothetical protein FRB94_001925 [Tulasnella sp. JGI-2019a]